MYVLTDYKNVIIHISETLDHQSNGNSLVDGGSLAIVKNIVKAEYEVAEVPSEIIEQKYCYTEEKGFYLNKNYVERYDTSIKDLETQITEIQLALVEQAESEV